MFDVSSFIAALLSIFIPAAPLIQQLFDLLSSVFGGQ